ncbi:MAG: T9SS type A sorting domain-containing protein [Hymenobacter sp.]|nr:MAG: T9SS type A sorting domain-containing protein [Hymenobacter sp.]
MPFYYPSTLLHKPLGAAALVGLLLARGGWAQTSNTGAAGLYSGSAYHGSAFTNTATGSFTNSSSTVYYAGASAATFTNSGSYTATGTGTDQFVGPGGAAGPQELAGTVAPAFANLLLANGSSSAFTVSNPAGVDVAGVLTLNNGITTTSGVAGAIRLASGATVAGTFGTARYVDGYVGKAGTASFTYPLGTTNPSTNTGNTTAAGAPIYAPITLSNPGGTAIRYVAGGTPQPTAFATQSAALQLQTVSMREYYPIGSAGAASGSTITMPYGNFGPTPAGTPYVADPNTLTIAAYNGTNWTNLSATATNSLNTTAQTVTVTLPTALSTTYTALALASTSAATPLPVQLVAFSATKKGADGQLSWRTASELNSAYFELQVSLTGTTWQALAKLTASGTSPAAHDYAYLDQNLARYGAPLLYYRLQQVDQDGSAHFSPVVSLSPDATTWQVVAYPNPFAADLTAHLVTPEAGPVTITLLDATGRVVLRREWAVASGSHTIALEEAQGLPPGAYTLMLRQTTHTSTVRVIHR